MKERPDDFNERSKKLKNMTDEELNNYFWELVGKVVDPLVDLAQTHTSPSIERSVLLRMGFNSLQAKALVEKIEEHNLLSKGAGNIVYQLSKSKNMEIIDTGKALINDQYWEDVEKIFEGGETNETSTK
jgi:D-ornithine 4,5-aminomutase subunit alpha